MKGNFFYKRLGSRITKIRKSKKITQKQLSKKTKINRTYLTQIENGKANPTIKVLAKIVFALEINLKEVFVNV